MRLVSFVGAALLASISTSHAATYDFVFTEYNNASQIDAKGTFTTGAAAVDPGYELLTGLSFSLIRDNDGTTSTGLVSQTTFQPGSAYNPTSQTFINHYSGNTYNNYGGGKLDSGGTTPVDFRGYYIDSHTFISAGPSSFYLFDSAAYVRYGGAVLTITSEDQPTATPEPATLVLLGTGLAAGAFWRRRTN